MVQWLPLSACVLRARVRPPVRPILAPPIFYDLTGTGTRIHSPALYLLHHEATLCKSIIVVFNALQSWGDSITGIPPLRLRYEESWSLGPLGPSTLSLSLSLSLFLQLLPHLL